ncbi:MAG: endonuclease [Chromatiales bacterium]|nr:endonuclease [Chromatiales bacterium]
MKFRTISESGARVVTALLALTIVGCDAAPDARGLPDYRAALPVFWSEVYPDGGDTLYCGHRFGPRHSREINIEHVFPMAWAMNAVGCPDRESCRASSAEFNRIEADLHNMYPARRDLNKARGSHGFGEVAGEPRRYGACDFEINERARQVEPPPASRGNVARAMFYMADRYGLKIFARQAQTLREWHQADPPDAEERRRNEAIARVQGTRNRFIDDPAAVGALRF